ncbi:hypothetical protein FDN13_14125 [Caloramator sp. E03]|uniref:hypothetical protein n=1 Tax=Caloramator sp. E03 TaxID=2576307 RepID=UPI0011100977|nr:hypothetical protein [Caloramator sp. E03]QCX34745.1 hypothetical protein FDN13_14125 [Caloramator sp. E03]
MVKHKNDIENSKLISAIAYSKDSQNSTHGYLEVGNDATIQAKARAMRNKNNTTVNVDEKK